MSSGVEAGVGDRGEAGVEGEVERVAVEAAADLRTGRCR